MKLLMRNERHRDQGKKKKAEKNLKWQIPHHKAGTGKKKKKSSNSFIKKVNSHCNIGN